MAGAGTLVGYALASGGWSFSAQAFALALSAVLVSGGGQTINDFFDAKIDEKVHPNRPIPRGDVAHHHAFSYAVLLFTLGNLVALLVGILPFIIAFLLTWLLMVYAGWLKPFKWLGNWLIGLSSGAVFVFGASTQKDWTLALLLGVLASLVTVGREIAKDLEDAKKGEKEKKTLHKLIGKSNAVTVATACTAVAMVGSILPLAQGWLGWYYIVPVALGDIVFVRSVNQLQNGKFHESQRGFKWGMVLCLIGFAVGLI